MTDDILKLIEIAVGKQRRHYPIYVPDTIEEPQTPLITSLPNDSYFPQTFDEYIGQDRAKEICKIIVDSANLEKRAIPNLLLSGPYGLGKTTLAKLILDRHKQPYRMFDGASAAKLDYFNGYILIDEAHNLPADICDRLNTLLDKGSVHIVACTTNPGALPAAFRSRFRNIVLEKYQEKEIYRIIENSLKRKSTLYRKTSISEIAKRSRLNPRSALQILSFSLEIMSLSKHSLLNKELVISALDKLGIDGTGLTDLDRRYLSILSSIKPTGLSQICAILGTNSETVELEIEPYLLQRGLIERTSKGRILHITPTDEQLLAMLEKSIEITRNRVSKKDVL